MKLKRKAGALCAVIFLLSWLFPFAPTASAVDPVDPADPGYIYAVDIEYGSLSFYYDYGIWNVNTMRYEAAATSDHPAAGTPDGLPGWYGFDETANRVAVINKSAGKSITVELTYRSLEPGELTAARAPAVVSGVEMTVTGANWENNSVTIPSGLQDSEGKPVAVAGFIQLSGEPQVNGAEYESDDMLPIGMFSLTITGWDP